MILRHAFCFVSLACIVVCLSAAQNPFPNSFVAYDLYKGIVKLKHRISALPSGSEIHWFDRIPSGTGPKAEGSQSLSYPPAEIVKQIKEYAEKRNIKVEILSSNPLGPATDSPTGRPGGEVSESSP
jgi:hypothetical protein